MITIRSEKPEDFDTIYEINKKVLNGPVFKVFDHLITLSRYYQVLIISSNSRYTFSVSSLIQKVRKSFCLGSQTIISPLAFAKGLIIGIFL